MPKSNPAGIKSIYDLTKPGVTVDEAASSVPVGSYTVQVLNQMGLNSAVQANVVSQETSDANVVAKVALGQVDAGFVYLSDYVINPTQLTLIKVPAWAQPKITYAMCVMTKSPNQAAAQAWVEQDPEPDRPGDLRQGRLPAADGARPDDREGLRPRRRRPGATLTITGHEPRGHDVGHLPGRPGEVQGRLERRSSRSPCPRRRRPATLTVTNPIGTATWKLVTIG